MAMDRRRFLHDALAFGAVALWGGGSARASKVRWRERRDLYPEGVASGDPDSHSVLLWTRRPFPAVTTANLEVQVAEDETFQQVFATAAAIVSAASDWTRRVLVGNLKPSRIYWYRFIDEQGQA